VPQNLFDEAPSQVSVVRLPPKITHHIIMENVTS
jgi:hypothetical protein